jgi:uncharacterized protein YabN with tetrapyrrole methylase and pyrophosphatase domain
VKNILRRSARPWGDPGIRGYGAGVLDAEGALRAANVKFERRFRAVEARLAADGRTPADSGLEEMDRLWDEVKAARSPD